MLDAEEALKVAQKKNAELETEAEELRKQAEEAKVRTLGTLQVIYSVTLSVWVNPWFLLYIS